MPNDLLRIRDWLTRCGELKFLYHQTIQLLLGRAKLESPVRYLRIEVKYAPEMAESIAVYYGLLGKVVFNSRYSGNPCRYGVVFV